ncbi:hypothetical protein [Halorussus salinus]|uniref:hypothetical protein n=1 Tax=Halorussus salinus TaxID=1364935 RepID=UPI001EE45C5A|nr:hypothetical protein [Halorussus salinus]
MSEPASDAPAGGPTASAPSTTTEESAGKSVESVEQTGDAAEPTRRTAEETASADPTADDEAAAEYEHLRRKKKERKGNAEEATVRDVFVGESQVVLTVAFPWTTDTERLVYDLDSDRDVLKLEALAESKGFDFEQVSFLDGESLAVVYTGGEWVPKAQIEYVKGEGSASSTFLTELRLLGRELARSPKFVRRLVRLSRTMTTKQAVIAVILVKKIIIVALVAWLLL